ncbi:T-box transcription factor TBX18-like [Mytilus californianus]|uniref:T-box transcription factor TBX18-like n=1 Tax=Mytilus californianus TaxID=6549 RepID=UPI002247E5A9|nr:T-box transcription factor TBX18-like [Mytilus californianus]
MDDTHSKNISIELCQSDLWHSFHALGTEMIITKSGRRMFPAVRCKVHGLDPKSKYRVYIDFVQLDRHKYRYVYHSSKWMVSGTGDNMFKPQKYSHPDCPMDGNLLNSQIISFERLKLTNNERSRNGQVSLLSMQRFLPRVHVERLSTENIPEEHFVTSFPQTSFMAVTAYQNQEITRLKIARNPFAKGFRESGKNRSSLEAMIECYGLHFTENEINRSCPKNEGKLIEQGYPSPIFSVSPLSDESTEVLMKNRLTTDNIGRTFSPDFGIKPTFNTFFSHEVPRVTYDFCGKSASALKKENGHSIADTDSFVHHTVRYSPYSDTSYYSHSVKPRLKVFHYDVC